MGFLGVSVLLLCVSCIHLTKFNLSMAIKAVLAVYLVNGFLDLV